MGMFVNPENSAFCVALNSEIYVDKTMLLAYTNKVMDTNSCFICNSRPRRFGKSITVNMLTAYYSRGSDSKDLFEDKKISKCGSYREHLNRYDVIRFDLQWFLSSSKPVETIVPRIEESIIAELKEYFPQEISSAALSLPEVLAAMHKASGRKCILPVKKLKTQSALNNFEEFTMLSPGPFAPFIGFTEEEVKELSRQYHRDFEEVKRWGC